MVLVWQDRVMTHPGGMHGRTGPLVVMMLAAAAATAACGPTQFPAREGFTDGGSESLGSETGVPDLPALDTETGDPECPELVNTGNVSLSSLDELELVDGVTRIEGNLELTGSFGELPEGLAPLRCLREIGGFFYVHDHDLRDFTGLERLKRIGGYAYFGQSFELQDFTGLAGLRQIGGFLNILDNFGLQSLDGRAPKQGALWMTYYPGLMLEWYPNVLVVSQLIPRSPTRTSTPPPPASP